MREKGILEKTGFHKKNRRQELNAGKRHIRKNRISEMYSVSRQRRHNSLKRAKACQKPLISLVMTVHVLVVVTDVVYDWDLPYCECPFRVKLTIITVKGAHTITTVWSLCNGNNISVTENWQDVNSLQIPHSRLSLLYRCISTQFLTTENSEPDHIVVTYRGNDFVNFRY